MKISFKQCLFALTMCVLALFAANAEAQQRVVLQPFTGPQAGRARAWLQANLKEQEEVELRDWNEVRARTAELQFSFADASTYIVLSDEFAIDAFISGRVRRFGRQWMLTLSVRSGENGENVGQVSWSGRTLGSLAAVQRTGYQRLRFVLARAKRVEASEAPKVREEKKLPPRTTKRPDEPEKPVTMPYLPRAYDKLSVQIGLGTMSRSLDSTLVVNGALDPTRIGSGAVAERRSYSSGGLGHAELHLLGDIYPGMYFKGEPFPWIGLYYAFHQTLGAGHSFASCEGRAGCMSMGNVDGSVNATGLDGGLRFRLKVDVQWWDPLFQIDIGFGMQTYSFDLNELENVALREIVPSMNYGYVDIGGNVSWAMGWRPLRFRFGVNARIGMSVGEDARRMWGVDTTSFGAWKISAGLQLRPDSFKGVFIDFGVEWQRFQTDFSGQTACRAASCSSGDLWEPWPINGGPTDSLLDDYLRLKLGIGYAY